MPTFHVLLRQAGPEWHPSQPMEEQSGWREHASFMDGLVDSGFIVLGGQWETTGGSCTRSRRSRRRKCATLASDPWSESHLMIESIEPWSVRLDAREPRH